MKQFCHILFFIFIVLQSVISFSQINEIKIYSKDSLENSFLKKMEFNKKRTNLSKLKEIDSLYNYLQRKGYVNANIESIEELDSILSVCVKLNKKVKDVQIQLPDDVNVINYVQGKNYRVVKGNIVIPFVKIDAFLNNLVLYYENMGYSFVTASLKRTKCIGNKLQTVLVVNKKYKRNIDHIVIKGYDKFPIKFMHKYGDFVKSNKFNKSKIKSIYESLNRIPFVTQLKKPQILFLKDSTLIYIYLKKKKNNLIDGVIGFGSNNDSKIEFNGNLNMELNNIFNKGEMFGLHWESNKESKLFDLNINIPYIFKSNFSPNVNFSIFTQDTTYVNINTTSVLKYHINQKNSLGGVFEIKKSIDLKKRNDYIENFKSNLFGLNYVFLKSTFNNPFYKNEKKMEFNVLYGNNKFENKSFSKFRFSLIGNILVRINAKNYLYIKNNSMYYFSENYLLNELNLIGGFESIRGFKEKSISANKYTITNVDYNLRVGKESYLYSIFDYAWIGNDFVHNNNSLFSLGAGYKTKLNSSIINVSYIVGFSNESSNSFNNSIFNLSFISFF